MSTAQLTVNDTKEALLARIAELETRKAVNSRLFQITPTGQVSMYGAGKFPVTKTYVQWQIIAKNMPALLVFLEEHKNEVSFKSDEQREKYLGATK
jgi:hypothetical protein